MTKSHINSYNNNRREDVQSQSYHQLCTNYMITFTTFPKTVEKTYTIIPRYQVKHLTTALQLAGETNFRITTKVSADIKPYLPAWFTPRYAIVISNFESHFLLTHMYTIMNDEDVNAAIDEELEQNAQEYENTHSWVETEGEQIWRNRTTK